MHLTVDGLGNQQLVRLTAGQRHDSTQAKALLNGFTFTRVIGDRAYAAANLIANAQARGSEAVIPSISGSTSNATMIASSIANGI